MNFGLVITKQIETKLDSMVDFIVIVAVNVNIVNCERKENIDHDRQNRYLKDYIEVKIIIENL